MKCYYYKEALEFVILARPDVILNWVLPRIPSMLWLALLVTSSGLAAKSVWPPLRTRDMLETLGALFLSQMDSWSRGEQKHEYEYKEFGIGGKRWVSL